MRKISAAFRARINAARGKTQAIKIAGMKREAGGRWHLAGSDCLARANPGPEVRPNFSAAEREVRRIAADPKFRAQYETAPKTLPALLTLIARRARLPAAAARRTLRKLPDLGIHLLPVDADLADAQGVEVVRRGKEWTVQATYRASRYEYTAGETEWKNGSPKNYTRARNDTYVRAYACIARGALVGVVHNTEFRLRAPTGYAWAHDDNGFALAAKFDGADCHITAADVIAARDDDCAALCRRIESARATRLLAQQAAESDAAAMEALAAGKFWVCRRDSLRAGNCPAGTDSWIARHDLDGRRHYPARAIRSLADDARVRLALMIAAKRAAAEAAAGVCILAEHV
jgi:hypothetical protein